MKVQAVDKISKKPKFTSNVTTSQKATSVKEVEIQDIDTSKSNQAIRNNFMSGISFKGHYETQTQYFGTSGGIATAYQVEKGEHRDIKTVTTLQEKYIDRNTGYKVYFADLNERVDKNNLDSDTNFVVEYQKTKMPTFSEVTYNINNNNRHWVEKDINNQIEHYSVLIDLYQKQNNEAQYLQSLNESRHDDFHFKIGKMYLDKYSNELEKATSNTSACESLINLFMQACEMTHLNNYHPVVLKEISTTEKDIAESKKQLTSLESERDKIKAEHKEELETIEKKRKNAPADEKDEYSIQATLAKTKHFKSKQLKELNEKVVALTKYIMKQEECLEYYKGETQKIESNSNFPEFVKKRTELIEQIRKIYEQNFSESL